MSGRDLLRAGRGRARAFTLVEVMIASLVLVFGIVTAITALQRGVQAMDRARNLALATQVLQSEMETLRLKNWAQLEVLQVAGTEKFSADGASSAAARFTCTRAITTPKTDMKEITLTAEWRGSDGRPQSAKLITRYARQGLNDYLSTDR